MVDFKLVFVLVIKQGLYPVLRSSNDKKKSRERERNTPFEKEQSTGTKAAKA